MELTTASLDQFVGGQIEVQNPGEGHLYCGQIKTIRVEGDGDDTILTVELDWMAKDEGYPCDLSQWVKGYGKLYQAGLKIYDVSDIGRQRICLCSPFAGEMIVLYPQGDGVLNHSGI